AFKRCTEKYLLRLYFSLSGLRLPAQSRRRTNPPMASSRPLAPRLFDGALLRARQDRARKLGAATFLLDRIAEDMAERLSVVMRDFKSAADVGTPGDQLRKLLGGNLHQLLRIDLPIAESEPLAAPAESLDLAV